MIKALVQIDQRARDAVLAAENKRSEAKTEIAQEKAKLYDSYISRAREHIDKMKAQEELESTRQQAAMEESFRTACAALEEQFSVNKDRWIEELVRRCVQL